MTGVQTCALPIYAAVMSPVPENMPTTEALPPCRDIGEGYIPFSISPAQGTVMVGGSAELLVKFAPLDVFDYYARLLCGSVTLGDICNFSINFASDVSRVAVSS